MAALGLQFWRGAAGGGQVGQRAVAQPARRPALAVRVEAGGGGLNRYAVRGYDNRPRPVVGQMWAAPGHP
ncbi:hypothetical protein ACIBI9_29415 [Nonomuraea sp. NPDC050451]|uniref:hypothetical protein n=1 Tax=Nonomuraea sp. NPDC050451 TaxID=3364364 RepID=UPI00379C9E2B